MRRRGRRARVVPRATYRLQLRPGFGFAAAAGVVPYIARLGVSHAYTSPYLQAVPGSTHGYDVVDPRRVNVELGGSRGHRRFGTILGEHRLGQVLDLVPNHMAIPGRDNPWWWDVLENGQASRYARYFDVDWDPPEAYLRNVVLLPVLADQYGRVLDAGEIRLERRGAEFTIRYHEHLFPVGPRSLSTILAVAAARSRSDDLAFVADAHDSLPKATETDRASIDRRHRDKEVVRGLLARTLAAQPRAAAALDAVIEATNADSDALDALLARQHYRLAHWRSAGRDLGYRRFFDVATLIGLRVEDDIVFGDSHGLVLRWIANGVLDGLRVDHPDGLADPAGYVRRLRAASPRGWLIVEKILAPGESVRSDWPIEGTTGYDFLREVGGLFVDPAGEDPFTELHARITGDARPFEEVGREARREILHGSLGSDLNRLAARFLDICEGHRRYRDHTRHDLHEALLEVLAVMPVYRTYARPYDGAIDELDIAVIEMAIAAAALSRPAIDPRLLAFLGEILTLRVRGPLESDLVVRFQQLSGAVMAKGLEDTAFYRYHRLVALNEVGGDPGRFGTSPDEFHAANERRAAERPATMLTTTTHDTKRSEDVRTRIAVLSEMPGRWERFVTTWLPRLEHAWHGSPFDASGAYLALQTVIGVWPIERDRLTDYLRKAAREAKVRTSWSSPDPAYERSLDQIAELLTGDPAFIADLDRWLVPLVAAGRVNSLAMVLLKLTSPGVPDIYQGTELWDLSLVDPDNRREVDFTTRESMLASLQQAGDDGSDSDGPGPDEILAGTDVGLPKLWVTHRTLQARAARPDLFDARGSYRPIGAVGPRADHVVAYERGPGALIVAPRLVHALIGEEASTLSIPADQWAGTTIDLPDGTWHDHLSGGLHHGGGTIPVGTLLGRFPVALLVRAAAG